jgi:hypothetical protein
MNKTSGYEYYEYFNSWQSFHNDVLHGASKQW